MAITNTNPHALKSVLSTVAKTAQSVGALVDTGTRSISMLDRFVGKASEEQELRYRKDRRMFVHNLVRDAASEQAEADIKVEEFMKQSAEHKRLFTASYQEFESLFADELGISEGISSNSSNS